LLNEFPRASVQFDSTIRLKNLVGTSFKILLVFVIAATKIFQPFETLENLYPKTDFGDRN